MTRSSTIPLSVNVARLKYLSATSASGTCECEEVLTCVQAVRMGNLYSQVQPSCSVQELVGIGRQTAVERDVSGCSCALFTPLDTKQKWGISKHFCPTIQIQFGFTYIIIYIIFPSSVSCGDCKVVTTCNNMNIIFAYCINIFVLGAFLRMYLVLQMDLVLDDRSIQTTSVLVYWLNPSSARRVNYITSTPEIGCYEEHGNAARLNIMDFPVYWNKHYTRP